MAKKRFSLVLKLAHTLFVLVLVPVYWIEKGPVDFLWFSDIALGLTLVALWFEQRLITSMMALSVVLFELIWCLDLVISLLLSPDVLGLTGYMFNDAKPLVTRLLSLFHIFIPFELLWMVHRLGYDPRGLPCQTLLAWLVLPLTWLLTQPGDPVNWVQGPGGQPLTGIHPILYLMLLMMAYPLIIYLPTHLALKKWQSHRAKL